MPCWWPSGEEVEGGLSHRDKSSRPPPGNSFGQKEGNPSQLLYRSTPPMGSSLSPPPFFYIGGGGGIKWKWRAAREKSALIIAPAMQSVQLYTVQSGWEKGDSGYFSFRSHSFAGCFCLPLPFLPLAFGPPAWLSGCPYPPTLLRKKGEKEGLKKGRKEKREREKGEMGGRKGGASVQRTELTISLLFLLFEPLCSRVRRELRPREWRRETFGEREGGGANDGK